MNVFFIKVIHFPLLNHKLPQRSPTTNDLLSTANTMAAFLLHLASFYGQITPTQSQHAPFIPNPRMIGGISPEKSRHPYIVSLTYFGAHFCGEAVQLLLQTSQRHNIDLIICV
jgi:hypothetical protein